MKKKSIFFKTLKIKNINYKLVKFKHINNFQGEKMTQTIEI